MRDPTRPENGFDPRGTTYYHILGVCVEAGRDEIKAAYRRKVLEWHPDRNQGSPRAAERFRAIQRAYEVLNHPRKRAEYDRRLGVSRPRNGTGYVKEGRFNHGDLARAGSEFFGVVLDGSLGPSTPDMRFDLQVSTEILERGGWEEIQFERMDCCPFCGGTGGGRHWRGCDVCSGAGQLVQMVCLHIRIPCGARPGMRLRVERVGDRLDPGGPRCDLVVYLHGVDGMRFS